MKRNVFLACALVSALVSQRLWAQGVGARLHRKASKKQMSTKPETLEVAKYVVVFTTRHNASAVQILGWYRGRAGKLSWYLSD